MATQVHCGILVSLGSTGVFWVRPAALRLLSTRSSNGVEKRAKGRPTRCHNSCGGLGSSLDETKRVYYSSTSPLSLNLSKFDVTSSTAAGRRGSPGSSLDSCAKTSFQTSANKKRKRRKSRGWKAVFQSIQRQMKHTTDAAAKTLCGRAGTPGSTQASIASTPKSTALKVSDCPNVAGGLSPCVGCMANAIPRTYATAVVLHRAPSKAAHRVSRQRLPLPHHCRVCVTHTVAAIQGHQ